MIKEGKIESIENANEIAGSLEGGFYLPFVRKEKTTKSIFLNNTEKLILGYGKSEMEPDYISYLFTDNELRGIEKKIKEIDNLERKEIYVEIKSPTRTKATCINIDENNNITSGKNVSRADLIVFLEAINDSTANDFFGKKYDIKKYNKDDLISTKVAFNKKGSVSKKKVKGVETEEVFDPSKGFGNKYSYKLKVDFSGREGDDFLGIKSRLEEKIGRGNKVNNMYYKIKDMEEKMRIKRKYGDGKVIKIFEPRRKNEKFRPLLTLDLHGFRENVVEDIVNRFIKECEKMEVKSINIVHGSSDGVVKRETRGEISRDRYSDWRKKFDNHEVKMVKWNVTYGKAKIGPEIEKSNDNSYDIEDADHFRVEPIRIIITNGRNDGERKRYGSKYTMRFMVDTVENGVMKK